MGYRPPPVADVSYTVTVSNELVLVNDSVNLDIDLSHGETHLFSQTDTSNKNKQFAFTRWSAPQSPYTDGLVLMGEPGRPDSYLYYDASGNVGDLVYDLQTISGDDYTLRYPIATTSTDVIMPYGSDLSFVLTNNATTPLTYEISGSYFDLSDVSNGTIAAGNTLTFSKTLNAYGKIRLFFNGKNYFRRFVPYQNYAVTVSGDTFYIDGAEAPKLYNQQDGLYMFDQTHSSNLGKPLTFTTSATDDGTATAYTVGVETIGTPGYANAYTLLDRNKGAGSLYYYNADVSGMGNLFDNVTPDQTYSVKTVVNSVGNTVFTISSDGTNYYAQEDISLNPGELYYFDTSDASISGHTLTFGTGVDDSVIPSEYIVRSIAAPGTTGANLYLDLRNYLFPMVDVRDVSYGVFTQAYGGVPFTVTFASGLTDGSFSLVDANGAAVALTSPSATDVSYGLSTVDITISNEVVAGTLALGGTANVNSTDVSFNPVTVIHNVEISNGVYTIDGVSRPHFYMTTPGMHVFDQSHSSNAGHRLVLGTTIDEVNSVVDYQYNVGSFEAGNAVTVVTISDEVIYYFSDASANMGSSMTEGSAVATASSSSIGSGSEFTISVNTEQKLTSTAYTAAVTAGTATITSGSASGNIPPGETSYVISFIMTGSGTSTFTFTVDGNPTTVELLIPTTIVSQGNGSNTVKKLNVPSDQTVSYILVGGGGGGGSAFVSVGYHRVSNSGNGGNGGDVKQGTVFLSAGTYTFTAGRGGAYYSELDGGNGGNSSITGNNISIVANGGSGGKLNGRKKGGPNSAPGPGAGMGARMNDSAAGAGTTITYNGQTVNVAGGGGASGASIDDDGGTQAHAYGTFGGGNGYYNPFINLTTPGVDGTGGGGGGQYSASSSNLLYIKPASRGGGGLVVISGLGISMS